MGRTRSHDIHLRLDDQEFNKLNEMVSKSIYSREKYIRMVLLEKKQILETPKTYLQFARICAVLVRNWAFSNGPKD